MLHRGEEILPLARTGASPLLALQVGTAIRALMFQLPLTLEVTAGISSLTGMPRQHLLLSAASLMVLAAAAVSARPAAADAASPPRLSRERLVFQTDFGDIHMAFYPDVRGSSGCCYWSAAVTVMSEVLGLLLKQHRCLPLSACLPR